MSSKRRFGLPVLAASILFGACQGRGLVDEGYPGAALATAHGSLEATAGTVRDPVSLAIAWRANDGAPDPLASLAGAIEAAAAGDGACVPLSKLGGGGVVWVTQPVMHTSSLPFQFKFSLLLGPPRDVELALEPLGGTGRAATGVVIAYVDGNHDGTYRAGDAGDRLVAMSASAARTQVVAFLDGRAPERWGVALEQGFGLVTRGAGAGDGGDVRPEVSRLEEAWVELSPELIGASHLCP